MSADNYLTISEPGHAHTRVLGSRFFGSALHAASPADADTLRELENRRYHDATHICFAARFGVGSDLVERSADVGEPKGTAGLPILREIRGRDLTNCLVLITRYFGGTKLGTGNLARAYAQCAAAALDAAVAVQVRILSSLTINCPFDLVSMVYHYARNYHAEIDPGEPSSEAVLGVRLPPNFVDPFVAVLNDQGRGRITIRSA